MDVLAVEAATRKAVDFVRQGGGPYLIEYRTYRFRAHSMYDAELYRPKEEVAQWKQRDPIASFEQYLRGNGLLHTDEVEKMETAIAAEIEEAVAFAEAGEWEPIEDLARDVYTPRQAEASVKVE
jgi:TPP-dependent pyruvate/acetoin dehydrogenase alpha subunit